MNTIEATKIKELLGGNDFLAKSKAYKLLESPDGISFRLPKEPYANGVNSVDIHTTPVEGLYSLEMGTQKEWGYFQEAFYPNLSIDELKAKYEASTNLDMW